MSQPNLHRIESEGVVMLGLAERFWALAPVPEHGEPTDVVSHLLAILGRFRALETRPREQAVTVATLSLATLLHQHEMLGDRTYASPEQLRGDRLTEASLVFSVSVLLFERLCHRHPFGAEPSPLRLLRMERAELGSGVNFFPRLPDGLRELLVRALSPEPGDRPAGLAALSDELARFVHEARGSAFLPGTSDPNLGGVALADPGATWSYLVRAHTVQVERRHGASPSRRQVERRRATRPSGRHRVTLGEQIRLLLEEPAPAPTPRAASAPIEVAMPRPRLALALGGVAIALTVSVGAWRALAPEDGARRGATARAVVPVPAAVPVPHGGTPQARPIKSGEVVGRGAAPVPAAVSCPSPCPTGVPRKRGQSSPASGLVGVLAPATAPDFSPEAAGQLAATRAGDCFSAYELGRDATFVVSLLYTPASAAAHKVYFPREPELDPGHIGCLAARLAGTPAGAAPDHAIAVEYRFTIAGGRLGAAIRRLR